MNPQEAAKQILQHLGNRKDVQAAIQEIVQQHPELEPGAEMALAQLKSDGEAKTGTRTAEYDNDFGLGDLIASSVLKHQ